LLLRVTSPAVSSMTMVVSLSGSVDFVKHFAWEKGSGPRVLDHWTTDGPV